MLHGFSFSKLVYTTKPPIHLSVKTKQRNGKTFRCSIRMTTNKSVERSHAPQETATDCGYVDLHANVLTIGLFATK